MNQDLHKKKLLQTSSIKEIRSKVLSSLIYEDVAPFRFLEWGALLALENKEWTKAEHLFSTLLERRKRVSDWMGLAKALFEQSRYEETEECYLEAINQIQEPGIFLFIVYKSLAEIYLLKEDFLMAEEYYNKASTLDPHCPSLIFQRAMMYLKEKNYDLAQQHFQNCLSKNLKHVKAWMGLALSRKALGDNELALACLKRCLDFDPENQRAMSLEKKWSMSILEVLNRFSKKLHFIA